MQASTTNAVRRNASHSLFNQLIDASNNTAHPQPLTSALDMEHRSAPQLVDGMNTLVWLMRSPRLPSVVSDRVKEPREPTGVLPKVFRMSRGR